MRLYFLIVIPALCHCFVHNHSKHPLWYHYSIVVRWIRFMLIGYLKYSLVLSHLLRGQVLPKPLLLIVPEKDEQQHCAQAWYPRMHLAGDPEDNKVPRSDSEDAAAH